MELDITRTEQIEITKEDFQDYEEVRKSGETNMFDIPTVISLSDNLTRDKIKTIMKNYDKLCEEYGETDENINERVDNLSKRGFDFLMGGLMEEVEEKLIGQPYAEAWFFRTKNVREAKR